MTAGAGGATGEVGRVEAVGEVGVGGVTLGVGVVGVVGGVCNSALLLLEHSGLYGAILKLFLLLGVISDNLYALSIAQ